MRRLLIFIGMTLFSYAGWWLGAKAGVVPAYVLGGIGSLAGVYIGWRINRDYFE